jgi:hypothetical protein
VRPAFTPQTAYIHPRVSGDKIRYFEWMGAAIFTADQRAGAMHGKQFLLDSVHAGIDSTFVYGRLDFAGAVPDMDFELVVNSAGCSRYLSQAIMPGRSIQVQRELRPLAS